MKSVRNRQRGGLRNHENYQAFMEMKQAYLDDFRQRISNLAKLAQQGYAGEATVLACCYLDALGYFRYLPDRLESRKTFMKFMLRYGKDVDLSKVSLLILGRLVSAARNPQGDKLLAWAKACEANGRKHSSSRTILRRFKKDYSDPKQLTKLLNDATIVGVLYNNVRSLGVHQGRFTATNHSTIEVGGISINGERILGWLNTCFEGVLPYLKRNHRWIRFGKYA
ncbi:MAG: hypothetical protein HOP35_09645 [Nitrospira sp.]|nr:hypothetical protein [Nitrospira sp.]